jgi:hypothetical protein
MAWQIIHLSENEDWNLRLTFNKYCQTTLIKRNWQLHLHPLITPLLISAIIRTGTENEDAIEILKYFESIAHHHPALQAALPQWRLDQKRRENQRRTEALRQQEQNRIEAERNRIEKAQREAERTARIIEHQLKSESNSAERNAWLSQLDHSSLPEKLRAACDSKWALTYFPDSWAEQIPSETAVLSAELRTQLLSKLMRLRKRNQWRTVRQTLIQRV